MIQDPFIGRTFGPVTVEDKIAVGGYGTVYRGIDPALGIARAVKIFHPHLSEEKEFRLRFTHEMKTLALLDHPAIVKIVCSIEEKDVTGFVMEYVPGKTIFEIVQDEGPFSPENARGLFLQFADAIRYAHALEPPVIHRDLSPDNLILRPDGRLKVMDFGISRTIQTPKFTQTGLILGKPEYMAPEQFEGEVDEKTDQYSLAIILYEMVVGDLPFTSTSPVALYRERLEKTIEVPPEIADTLPNGMVEAIEKGCRKEPARRFESVAALVEAVRDACVSSAPAAVVPAPSQVRTDSEALLVSARTKVATRQFRAALDDLEVLVDGAPNEEILALKRTCEEEIENASRSRRIERHHRRAVEAGQTKDPTAMRAEVETFFRHLARVRDPERFASLAGDLRKRFAAVCKRAEQAESDRSRRMEQEMARGRALLDGGDVAAAVGAFTAVLAEEEHPEARSLLDLARVQLRIAEEEAAQKERERRQIEEALARGKELLENWEFAEAIGCFQQILSLDEQHAEARSLLEDCHDHLEDVSKVEKIGIHYNQGLTFYKSRKFREAIACFNRVLDFFPGHKGALLYRDMCLQGIEKRDLAERLTADGIAAFRNSRYSEALRLFGKALAADPRHPAARRYRAMCQELGAQDAV